jgi:hypothetical protein
VSTGFTRATSMALSRLRNCCCSAEACACSFDLDDHLNLDSVVEGKDTRSLQHYLGHKNIQHTVRYTELASDRFKNFWR